MDNTQPKTEADGIETGIMGMADNIMTSFYRWVDEHETLTSVIIVVETIVLFFAILYHNFTTNI